MDSLPPDRWINYQQTYYRIPVAEDGIYRISYELLQAAGLRPASVAGNRYRLYAFGEEAPLYVSSGRTPLAPGGFLEFYGQRNRGAFDRGLYSDPEAPLNPFVSLITDTAIYFLTVDPAGAQGLRVRNAKAAPASPSEPQQWGWRIRAKAFADQFYARREAGKAITSTFDYGEGYGSPARKQHELFFQTPKPYAKDSIPAFLRLRLLATGEERRHITLSIGEEALTWPPFHGPRVIDTSLQLPAALLNRDLQGSLQLAPEDGGRLVLAYAELRYPQALTRLEEFPALLEFPARQASWVLELDGNDHGLDLAYEKHTHRRLDFHQLPAGQGYRLPAASRPYELFLATASKGFFRVDRLDAVRFRDFRPLNGTYLILADRRLSEALAAELDAYVQYRSSAAGGAHRVVVADVQRLYDQYAYGLRRHPLAVRHFVEQARQFWPGLGFVFIVGKGREFTRLRRKVPAGLHLPTFGLPGSDHLLINGGADHGPPLAVGRLPVTKAGQLDAYLQKVTAYESFNSSPSTIDARAWVKRLIHLSGGQSYPEQQVIADYLDRAADQLEHSDVGVVAHRFYKSSTTTAVEQSPTRQLRSLIEGGVSLITFFGHSSANTFDYSINDPAAFDNRGRYPVFVALGCRAGQIHADLHTVSEAYTFAPAGGAVAFMASSGLGYIRSLGNFLEAFYRRWGESVPGAALGTLVQEALQAFAPQPSIGDHILRQQLTLNGDPGLQLPVSPGPDFALDAPSLRLHPTLISTDQDSIRLSLRVFNLGRRSAQPLRLEIRRTFPSGKQEVFDTLLGPAPTRARDYRLCLPLGGQSAAGNNQLQIRIDPQNEIAERPAPQAEANNGGPSASLTFFVYDERLYLQHPKPDARIRDSLPILSAFASNALAPRRHYHFQLDRSPAFDSPALLEGEVRARGGVIRWQPPAPLSPGLYYWRVRMAERERWRQGRFRVLRAAAADWSQSEPAQYAANSLEGISIDAGGQPSFAPTYTDVRVTTGRYPDIARPEVAVNNNPSRYWNGAGRVSAGFYVAVFDGVSKQPWWNSLGGRYGSQLGDRPHNVLIDFAAFPFSTHHAGSRQSLVRFLRDTIPQGHYVLLFSVFRGEKDLGGAEWSKDSLVLGTDLVGWLEAQGAQKIRALAEHQLPRPYYCFFRKGDTGFPLSEQLGAHEQRLTGFWTLRGRRYQARMWSPRLGPARKWDRLSWRSGPSDGGDADRLTLLGIDSAGDSTVLLQNIRPGTQPLSPIDAGRYPYLRLRYHTEDSLERTLRLPGHWSVYYRGLPDLMLDPEYHWQSGGDTLASGQPLRLALAVRNGGESPAHGSTLRYRWQFEGSGIRDTIHRLDPLAPGAVELDTLHLSTAHRQGDLRLEVTLNPAAEVQEYTRANNRGSYAFYLRPDRQPPLLDVTFDGERIAHGSLVSAQPRIAVRLEEAHPYPRLRDTQWVDLELRTPDSRSYRRLTYARDLRWAPAEREGDNRLSVYYEPALEREGAYRLRVRARDPAGNLAGKQAYEIEFRVVPERRISNLVNYPNPFSRRTRFAYELTGAEPLRRYRIRIFTLSGRLVRELGLTDLGPLRVGRHLTEGFWDGTDAYGDPLANGVYFYQLSTDEAQEGGIAHHPTTLDRFFHRKLGKLVILR